MTWSLVRSKILKKVSSGLTGERDVRESSPQEEKDLVRVLKKTGNFE